MNTTNITSTTIDVDVPVAGTSRTCAVRVTAPAGLGAEDLVDLLGEVVRVGTWSCVADVDGEWRVVLDVASGVYDRDGNPIPGLAEATVYAVGREA